MGKERPVWLHEAYALGMTAESEAVLVCRPARSDFEAFWKITPQLLHS